MLFFHSGIVGKAGLHEASASEDSSASENSSVSEDSFASEDSQIIHAFHPVVGDFPVSLRCRVSPVQSLISVIAAAKVCQITMVFLCHPPYYIIVVFQSYSGSKVTGDSFPAAACEERLQNLGRQESQPDYILIYAGFNDFASGTELISSLDTYGFEDSYDQMLRTIRQNYPSARTVCATNR